MRIIAWFVILAIVGTAYAGHTLRLTPTEEGFLRPWSLVLQNRGMFSNGLNQLRRLMHYSKKNQVDTGLIACHPDAIKVLVHMLESGEDPMEYLSHYMEFNIEGGSFYNITLESLYEAMIGLRMFCRASKNYDDKDGEDPIVVRFMRALGSQFADLISKKEKDVNGLFGKLLAESEQLLKGIDPVILYDHASVLVDFNCLRQTDGVYLKYWFVNALMKGLWNDKSFDICIENLTDERTKCLLYTVDIRDYQAIAKFVQEKSGIFRNQCPEMAQVLAGFPENRHQLPAWITSVHAIQSTLSLDDQSPSEISE